MCEKIIGKKSMWRAILGIVMLATGCACFVMSCVSAMVLLGKD